MKTGFGTSLGMGTKFLKECVLNRPTSNMANALEPFTHKPCRIVECTLIITRMNRNRDEPRFGMLLTTPSKLLTKSDIPIITERLETFLTLTARNEQSESSDIPRILSQITHWQRNVMVFAGVPAINYPDR